MALPPRLCIPILLGVIDTCICLSVTNRMPLPFMKLRDNRLPLGLKRSNLHVPSWETCRSGDECDVDKDVRNSPPPRLPFHALHQREYKIMRQIQRMPGLLHISLAVHYSLLPKVITPALALIVWLVSLPRGLSIITFVCAADLVNTAMKWAVQRPRPRWYSPGHESGLEVKCGNIAWEVDLSFPSAHTQFFSGLGFCAAASFGQPAGIPLVFGAIIGLTRNYLSMHWPSDTLAALVIGAALGGAWGRLDPVRFLLGAGSPLLSFCAATAFTLGLLSLMIAVRQAVPPVSSDIRSYWYQNALVALPEAERVKTMANPRRQLKPRNLKSKIPMLTTVWSALTITGLYPLLLPHASLLPGGSLLDRSLQTAIGLAGLGGVMLLKNQVKSQLMKLDLVTDRVRGAFKALTYVAICAWCFIFSQLTHEALLKALKRAAFG